MILRLVRADVTPAIATRLLAKMRDELLPVLSRRDGLFGFTCGFRHDAGRMQFLSLSCWADLTSIGHATGGRLDRPALPDAVAELLDRPTADHYELVEPAPAGLMTLEGAVLGVVTADVREHVEANAQDMIRNVRPEVEAAGVIGLYVGRRVTGSRTQLIVLALWRDRASLRRFGQTRSKGMIDAEFLQQLERWSFETFDCISPDRLLVPSTGPAVLLADDERRYVDASPGVEAIVGVPGELLLRRTVDDLMPPEKRTQVPELWRSLMVDGAQAGDIVLLRPDGVRVALRYRARANHPERGLHASVLTRLDGPTDERPVEEIVASAFSAAATA